jgi:hypothetical protein
MPARYYAEIDEYVWLEEEQPEKRLLLGKPDTFIRDTNSTSRKMVSGAGGVAIITQPVQITLPIMSES